MDDSPQTDLSPLDLQTQVPQLAALAAFRFQLRHFLSFSEVASERAGIQAQQYQLMQVIAAMPATEQASISYLADRMVLRHNSTVELVDRAEKAGLVARRNDAKDLRKSLVVLTPHGIGILRQLVEDHVREIKRINGDLSAALRAVVGSETE
ncbi:MAG: MarR family transcriptional regulator [Acidobacteriaceae bacterium]|nr:MarR family transcriptional regulator [Acidobacteriaceae bacterium]